MSTPMQNCRTSPETSTTPFGCTSCDFIIDKVYSCYVYTSLFIDTYIARTINSKQGSVSIQVFLA